MQSLKFNMENILEVKQLLSVPKDIVITSHRNPDGDALGSTLALSEYLQMHGHAVKVIYPSEYPDIFGWMKDVDKAVIDDLDPEAVDKYLKEAEIIFILDYNALDRVDRMGEVIGKMKGKKIMIDHHLYPQNCVDYMFSDSTASSTCEMVFEFIENLESKDAITVSIGESLFTGILTDTGSFKYSTSPKLFKIVASLLEIGVDDTKLQELIFNSMPLKNLNLLGYCLNQRMEILHEFNTGLITLSKQDYEDFDIQRGDTEGIVNYLLKLKEVTMAAFITEQPTIVKISLRSKGDFSVQEICQKHFKGGGHLNASGGYSFQSLSGTVKRFKALLPDYKEKLLNAKAAGKKNVKV